MLVINEVLMRWLSIVTAVIMLPIILPVTILTTSVVAAGAFIVGLWKGLTIFHSTNDKTEIKHITVDSKDSSWDTCWYVLKKTFTDPPKDKSKDQ